MGFVAPKTAADADDHGTLVAGDQLDLLTGRGDGARRAVRRRAQE
jgi:hypothetical protein